MSLSPSPGLVSAPHHGGRFPLPSLVEHRVHELEDVRRTELEGRTRTQHRRLCDSLPVDKGVSIWAVRRHRHHTFTVHEVAVVGQDPRTEQLEGNKDGYVRNCNVIGAGTKNSLPPLIAFVLVCDCVQYSLL